MRNPSNRNAKTLAILSAAAGFAVSAHLAYAAPTDDTWVNGTTGNWSVTTNWQGGAIPVAGPTTILTFNATGTQTYTSTNDLVGFNLGTLNINNTGTGVITIAGNGGILNTTDTQAPIFKTGSGAAVITGGGTMGTIHVTGGTLTTSGNWNLRSDKRQNDPLTATDNGFWAGNINAGAWIQDGGVITTGQVAGNGIAVAPLSGDTGLFRMQNAASWNDPNSRMIINQGNGTIEVLSGSVANVFLIDMGRQTPSGSGFLKVDGLNSSVTNTQFVAARGTATGNTIVVSAGGKIITNGNTFLADGADATTGDPLPGTATLSMNNGTWTVAGDGAATGFNQWGLEDAGTVTMINNSRATTVHTFVGSDPTGSGTLSVASGSIYTGTDFAIMAGGGAANAGTANTIISAGGTANGGQWTFGQDPGGVSNVTVTGAGAVLNGVAGGVSAALGGDILAAANTNTSSNFTVSAGGVVNVPAAGIIFFSGGLATGTGDLVDGGITNASVNAATINTGAMDVGSGPNGVATLTVSNGGAINTNGLGFFIGDANEATGFATGLVTVTGANSKIAMSSGTAELDVAPAGHGTLAIAAGGAVSTVGNMFVSPSTTSVGAVTVNASTLTVGGQMQIGGAGGSLGAASSVTLTNGTLNVGTGSGLLAVYQTSTLTIGSSARVNGDTDVDGWIAYNNGTFNTTGTLTVAGRVQLSDAARVNGSPTNKKTLEAGRLDFTASGIVDLNDNDALLHNNTLTEVQNYIKTGRNAGFWNGTMMVSTAAKNNANKTTGLGAITGANYKSTHAGTTSFNGRALVNTDIVVKYTYNGDSDLSGKVDGADYARIDTSFNNQVTQGNIGGWFNGDSDYSGKIDGADYALIDAAFNSQGTVVLGTGTGQLAGPDSVTFASTGMDGASDMQRTMHYGQMAHRMDLPNDGNGGAPAGSVVPEPGVLGLAGVAMLGALSRRRRSR